MGRASAARASAKADAKPIISPQARLIGFAPPRAGVRRVLHLGGLPLARRIDVLPKPDDFVVAPNDGGDTLPSVRAGWSNAGEPSGTNGLKLNSLIMIFRGGVAGSK